jgi:hypothetical protein
MTKPKDIVTDFPTKKQMALNLTKQLRQVKQQISVMKRTPAYAVFNFYLHGQAGDIWPRVLSTVEDAVGKPARTIKDLNDKRSRVRFDDTPTLVGRERALALWSDYTLILCEEIGSPNYFGTSRLQFGKGSFANYLEWN